MKDKLIEFTPIKDEITTLISQAITNNVSVDTMERLLAMRRELKAERAKEAFDSAMAAFQAECPTIQKKKKVFGKDGKKRFSFAPIEDIIEQVKNPLGQHGLSYTFRTIQTEKEFGVTCVVKHKMGYAEETSFVVPIGTEDYMTNVQKFGARNTYCKRYAFCNAFGISTEDEDTDAGEKDKATNKKGLISPDDANKITATQTQEELHALCGILKLKYTKPDALKALIDLYNKHKNDLAEALAEDIAIGLEKEKIS